MGGRETRLLVADLVAEAAIGGHFVAIPLGFFGPPFAPLGTLLGPKPKGQGSMETQGLSPEIRFGPKGHLEQSASTPDAEPNELFLHLQSHSKRGVHVQAMYKTAAEMQKRPYQKTLCCIPLGIELCPGPASPNGRLRWGSDHPKRGPRTGKHRCEYYEKEDEDGTDEEPPDCAGCPAGR